MTMTSVIPFAMVNMMRDEIVADSVKEFSGIYDKKGLEPEPFTEISTRDNRYLNRCGDILR